MAPKPEFMTTREVADELRVHPATVRRWASDDLLPVVTLPGGTKRFRRADVERLTGVQVPA